MLAFVILCIAEVRLAHLLLVRQLIRRTGQSILSAQDIVGKYMPWRSKLQGQDSKLASKSNDSRDYVAKD